jgi:hypothetical protein
VLADFTAVISIAKRVIGEEGFLDRISMLPVDAIVDPLGGPYDLVVMAAFIQVLKRDQARRALHNISDVTVPGGSIYIIGKIVDHTRMAPVDAAMFNVNFLNIYNGGQAYSESEYKEWLTAAGFENFETNLVPGHDGIITARKKK